MWMKNQQNWTPEFSSLHHPAAAAPPLPLQPPSAYHAFPLTPEGDVITSIHHQSEIEGIHSIEPFESISRAIYQSILN